MLTGRVPVGEGLFGDSSGEVSEAGERRDVDAHARFTAGRGKGF